MMHDNASNLLILLWHIALVCTGMGFGTLLVLIVRRVWLEWLCRRQCSLEERFRHVVYAWLEQAATATSVPAHPGLVDFIPPRKCTQLIPVIVDIVRLTTGNSHRHLAQFMTETGLVAMIDSQFASLSTRDKYAVLTLWRALPALANPALLDVLLDSRDDNLRLAALQVLAGRQDPQGLQRMLSEAETLAARIAPVVLGEVFADFGAGAVPSLLMFITEGHSLNLRLAALAGLARLPALFGINMLAGLTHDPEPAIRTAIFDLMARQSIPAKGIAATLASGFADPEWEIRVAALKAAGTHPQTELLPAIRTMLADPQWWVRFYAARALLAFGANGAAVLQAVARQQDRQGRVAQLALAEAGFAI
jgi:HEAT repeats